MNNENNTNRDMARTLVLSEIYAGMKQNEQCDAFKKASFSIAYDDLRLQTAYEIYTDTCGSNNQFGPNRPTITSKFVLELIWSKYEEFLLANYNTFNGAVDWNEAPIFNTWANGNFDCWYIMNNIGSKVSNLVSNENHKSVPKSYLALMNRALDSYAKNIDASIDLFEIDSAPEELNHESFDILTCKDILKQESIICDLGDKGWKLYHVDAPQEWEN